MKDILEHRGETITFYSYKGGVGRSMALINAACLLALRGKKVLIIDWDLEAPGLHSFFNGQIKDKDLGLVELVIQMQKDIKKKKFNFEEEIQPHIALTINKYIKKDLKLGKDKKVVLDIIKAGKFDDSYSDRMSGIDWMQVYKDTPSLFRSMAYHLESQYDYILIDSRTGLADTAGISTMLMPSKLVLVYVLNKQNLDGVIKVAHQSYEYRINSFDERDLKIYPLPSRIEKSTNPADQKTWRDFHQKRFEDLFKDIYHLDKCNLDNYIDKCQIPYVISYAYGENIPVLSERITDANTISFDYNSFLETLISDFQPWEVLSDDEMRKKGIEHFSEGFKFHEKKIYEKAISEYEKALKYISNDNKIYENLANAIINKNFLSNNVSPFVMALQFTEKAIGIDPKSFNSYFNSGLAKSRIAQIKSDINLFLSSNKDFDKAIELNQQSDERFFERENYLETIASKAFNFYYLYHSDGYENYKNEFLNTLDFLEINKDPAILYNLACLYALSDQKTKALENLSLSLKEREIDVNHVVKDNDWINYLEDPEFEAILEMYS